MKLRFGLLLAVLVLAVLGFVTLSPAGGVSAQEPEMAGEVDGAYFYGEDAATPRWLRYSIVYCAAKVVDFDVDQVKAGLRNGHSLMEIGIRAGVRPFALESGILRCELNLLERLVNAGELNPGEARRIYQFLTAHIARMINWSTDG
jgi:hypothetical protein